MKMHGLKPGDKVTMDDDRWGVLITSTFPHPLHANLGLYVWRLQDGEISLDALHPLMEVQGMVDSSQREHHIYRAIFPPIKKRRR